MKVFNSLEEMKLYYNEKINIYEFIENNRLIDIKIDFDLNMECNIKARNIKANNISFYAVCFAYNTFVCNSIKGRRENSKYFCLDSEVVIKSQKS